MMRKPLTFLKAAAIAVLIAGCGETGKEIDPEVAPEIRLPEDIVTSGISFESASQSVTLSFNTTVAWSATVSANWVTIYPSSGEAGKNSMEVKADENKTGQPRSATVTITDKESTLKASVAVHQEAFVATLDITPESLTFSAGKGEEMLTVTSNTDWVITKDAEWIILDPDKGEGTATVAAGVTENTSLTSRTGTITVATSDGSVRKTVSVQQAGVDVVFSIEESEFNVAAAGESFTVKVSRNIGYKISSQPDWVKQTDKTSGGDTDTYTFKAEANSSTEAREGPIVFCNDNNECVTVSVKQSGANASLSASPAELAFTAKSESKTFAVTSNTAWTATSSASWAKINATGGSGDAQVTVTAEENASITERSATISLKTTDGKATATVKVTQSAADVIFSVDKNEFNVAAAGESFTVKVSRNIGYKISSQPDWVKQTDKTSGGDTDTYTFKAEANSSTEAREGPIVFCNDNNECVTVSVKQSGTEPDELFSVSPASFDIDGKQQDISMTVTANVEYSLSSYSDWMSLKSESSGTYTFTVSENGSTSARSGSIVFKSVSGSALTVTVSQSINAYTSSDYSQDGVVTKIHSATVGKGIDVVFVGDAFSDKDQNLFNKHVDLGMEAFFTEEPFKSTKDRFNIYRIGSVSKNGIIAQEGGDTKFSAQFGDGTYIKGNDNDVFSFVRKNMPSVDLTKTIVFVIVNKAKYAGTCWMYSNNQAICYVPLCRSEDEYAGTLRHEGCGHGFGKLADEYFYTSRGTIPETEIADLKKWRSFADGFYENVDLTSDPAAILWSRFISDSRYSGKVGIYEGGYTYPYGVYRPTENSIMRYNTGGFNAPSREAIYKKIMKFSEGEAWTYDYETFVAFDAPARSAEAVTRAAAQCAAVDVANFIPLAPPVRVLVGE